MLAALLSAALTVPFWGAFQEVAGPQAPERAAQCWAESGFNPRAVSFIKDANGNRKPCAYGLAQFTPPTWKRYGKPGTHPTEPGPAIEAQHKYMTDLERMLGSWEAALGGYNAGPGHILRARRLAITLGYQGRDAWKKALPRVTGQHAQETLNYLPRCVAKARQIRAHL